LHLYRYHLSVAPCSVDLADRSAGDRLILETVEQRCHRLAELRLDYCTRMGGGKGRYRVEQTVELIAIFRRQQVVAKCQRLAQLDPHAAQLLEAVAQRRRRAATVSRAQHAPAQDRRKQR
jgi:hypothetical protein